MKWYEESIEEIEDQVFRVPLPLPSDSLRAVNAYILVGDNTVTLVDPGWDDRPTRELLGDVVAKLGHQLSHVDAALVTHLHRDHLSMAIALRDELGIEIVVGDEERVGLEWATTNRWDTPAPQIRQLRHFGAHDLAAALENGPPDPDITDTSWQMADTWIKDGQHVTAGRYQLEALATPGHTRGHTVFKHHSNRFMFTGDHLLPHITPSIGFDAVPVDSPLSSFLLSLKRIGNEPGMRYFPAHGPVSASTHDRVAELIEHHDRRMGEFLRQLTGASAMCAADVARRVPWTSRARAFDELDSFNQMLAVIETDAHLMFGFESGILQVTEDDGVRSYSLPATGA